jgi:hypothetical protein
MPVNVGKKCEVRPPCIFGKRWTGIRVSGIVPFFNCVEYTFFQRFQPQRTDKLNNQLCKASFMLFI